MNKYLLFPFFKRKREPMAKTIVSDKLFVETYVTCNSYDSLALYLNMKPTSVQARAAKLRKTGVNLVPYERKKKEVDVEGLNSLIN